jgi:AraC-like DNA-binding protein
VITGFQIVPLYPRLRQYVDRIFIIESSGKLPFEDLKLIVPNACPKLVIPFRNDVIGKSAAWEYLSKENTISLIGISDIPASVDFHRDAPAGNITVEFTPLGAYKFLPLDWSEVSNGICDYAGAGGQLVAALERLLRDTEALQEKTAILQRFLIDRLDCQAEDPIFDFCIQKIVESKGKVNLKELEKYTGYSARWLNMKFHSRIGISPKNLASIIRFQQYYRSLITNSERFFLEKEFYNYYYDQSHFIRDFKRFTGHSPTFLSRSGNDYDTFFYRD